MTRTRRRPLSRLCVPASRVPRAKASPSHVVETARKRSAHGSTVAKMINPRDINAGKVDRCLVADCPEHWRCLDIEHPERCDVYRMMTRDKARKIERERERERSAEEARRQKRERAERRKFAAILRAAGNAIRDEAILRPVRDEETGMTYGCADDAAALTGCTSYEILHDCASGGGRFCFVERL